MRIFYFEISVKFDSSSLGQILLTADGWHTHTQTNKLINQSWLSARENAALPYVVSSSFFPMKTIDWNVCHLRNKQWCDFDCLCGNDDLNFVQELNIAFGFIYIYSKQERPYCILHKALCCLYIYICICECRVMLQDDGSVVCAIIKLSLYSP